MPAFSQTHETTIAAAPERVHPLIADFHEWVKWSPWEGVDPDLKREYDGSGIGATYRWSGNKQAGEGSMEFTSIETRQIVVDLAFLKPFKTENTVTFDLTPVSSGTQVAWTMSGQRNLLFSVMRKLFFDKAIGKDFDRGLAALKAEAEKP